LGWGAYDRAPVYQQPPRSPLPRAWGAGGSRGVRGVHGAMSDAGGAGRAAAGSLALLVVVGPAQELGRGAQPVPAPGPTGRKSLPACGGDSLAERAPPAPLQIS